MSKILLLEDDLSLINGLTFAFKKESIGVQGVQTRLKRNVRFESK